MNPSSRARRAALALLAAAAVLVAGCASPRTASRLAPDDQVLAMQAAQGGRYEVDAGALATGRATSPEVRAYGQMLVDHHQAANAELVALLQSRGLQPPTAPSSLAALRMQRLASQAGAEFDREFIRTAGIAAHVQQIALFEQARRDAEDPALRAWFERTLPSLREHLASAQALAAGIALRN